jgi:hypothetical protein
MKGSNRTHQLEMERLKAEGLVAIHRDFAAQRAAFDAEINQHIAEVNRELAAMDRALVIIAVVVVAAVLWVVVL